MASCFSGAGYVRVYCRVADLRLVRLSSLPLKKEGRKVLWVLTAIQLEICEPIFGQFSAKLGSRTPLDRRGSSCSAGGCTANQPRTAPQKLARLPSSTQVCLQSRLVLRPSLPTAALGAAQTFVFLARSPPRGESDRPQAAA
jgi:hypothetical protein